MLDKGKLVAVVSMYLSKVFDFIQHNLLVALTQGLWCGREKYCALQGLFVGETFQNS